ncbi:MAG: NAD(P)(+) transhydrogenase (Re/Si-specific) subunit beta [Elusimicrobia bacterium]|nr:NAD(P)(+) transhydrogenase (Re/Si-specific) subunit beta [Elusimicrobiota bacterium]
MEHVVQHNGVLIISYIVASVLFILSLGGLSNPETSRRGNWFGIIGMAIAVVATFFHPNVSKEGYGLLISMLLIGGVIGSIVASKIAITAMPQLIAGFHSFVGLAAVLVGINSYMESAHLMGAARIVHETEVVLGVFIGAITFTGSIVAFGKLQTIISSKPLLLPGRHMINILMFLGAAYCGYLVFGAQDLMGQGMPMLIGMTVIAFVLGWHLVMSIGGADMPVVISMLNSYSGWAAAATGFLLGNNLLIITGALVGSSGAILSYIMCKAMNRSLINVIFGGFGAKPKAAASGEGAELAGEAVATNIEDVVSMLKDAKKVIIVPGYGLAVARAHHPLKDVVEKLRKRGVDVKFAIHPVAGRLPGHMNVLLAEANIPYDIVLEMDEINEEFPETDVALIIGANDIVSPGALEDPSSPIYGMPVIEAWKSKTTVVLKRSMAAGYAGVDNPLFYKENTLMLFGDAKKSIDTILAQLQ